MRKLFDKSIVTVTLCTCLAVLTGCATPPPAPPAPAPQVQSLAEYMSEASKARSDNMTAKERDTYRAAARQYPTAKEPWAKLAEGYFESADYGNAILAAQEVLQRDPADAIATGVLAVSGLRVSTQALSNLRTQNNSLAGDTRSQAEGLTRSLRELLGENILVPPPMAEAPAPAPRKRAATAKPAAPSAVSTAVPAPSAAAVAKPAPANVVPAAAKPSDKNPFDVLK